MGVKTYQSSYEFHPRGVASGFHWWLGGGQACRVNLGAAKKVYFCELVLYYVEYLLRS